MNPNDAPPPTDPSQQPNPDKKEQLNSAVTSLGNSAEQINLPKKLSRFNQIKGMAFGFIFILVAVVAAVLINSKPGQTKGALLVGGMFGLFGLLIFIISFLSYKNITKAEKTPRGNFNQFQTSTSVEYKMPFDKAKLAAGEAIGSWLGPINRQGLAGVSYEFLGKETMKISENTLLFTDKQVIALMLGPQDLPDNPDKGVMGNIANQAIKASDQDAFSKTVQFEVVNRGKWSQMVANLQAQPLDAVLQSHLNYGLPYSRIQSVEVKTGLVNPGFIFHLGNGQKIKYATTQKGQIQDAAQFMGKFVKV